MEKEIIWDDEAKNDIGIIINYLLNVGSERIANNFKRDLHRKLELLKEQPYIGHRSSKYPHIRKTIISKNYLLIYTIKGNNIIIMRLKHGSMS